MDYTPLNLWPLDEDDGMIGWADLLQRGAQGDLSIPPGPSPGETPTWAPH